MKPESVQKLNQVMGYLRTGGRGDLMAADLLSQVLEAELEGGTDLSSEEIALLRAGKVIDAIKSVRARKSAPDGSLMGLKEAKELVESIGNKLGLRDLGDWRMKS